MTNGKARLQPSRARTRQVKRIQRGLVTGYRREAVVTFTCAQASTGLCNSENYDIQGPAMSTTSSWNSQPAVSGGTLLGASVKCKVTLGSVDLGSVSGQFDNLFFATEDLFFDGFEAP